MKRPTFCFLFALLLAGADSSTMSAAESKYEFAAFSVDVTPPIGHPLIGGLRGPAKKVIEPLYARGFVLTGAGKPIVLVSIDWCEIRNDAYEAWRSAIAKAVDTDTNRVLATCVHQHDAPLSDLTAQKLLDANGLKNAMIDPEFHARTVERVAKAAGEALKIRTAITHFGLGEAKITNIASNRRTPFPDGKVRYARYSSTRDPVIQGLPDGLIDPMLKTISFWAGDKALAAVSFYATHPMSYYGGGDVNPDFPGMARMRRQREDVDVLQIYVSGCAGDITAGKYNDGGEPARQALTERMYQAMLTAWKETKTYPLESVEFHSTELRLPPWDAAHMRADALSKKLADTKAGNTERIQASMGLSWLKRLEKNLPIDLPVVDLNSKERSAQIVLLPAEAFVGYQLLAQKVRPDRFVAVAGYGECAPGYIPTDFARKEGFSEEHGWCWVAPDVEKIILSALEKAQRGNYKP